MMESRGKGEERKSESWRDIKRGGKMKGSTERERQTEMVKKGREKLIEGEGEIENVH